MRVANALIPKASSVWIVTVCTVPASNPETFDSVLDINPIESPAGDAPDEDKTTRSM